MGTHPIFESDFDCLTEFKIFYEMSPEYTSRQQSRRLKGPASKRRAPENEDIIIIDEAIPPLKKVKSSFVLLTRLTPDEFQKLPPSTPPTPEVAKKSSPRE